MKKLNEMCKGCDYLYYGACPGIKNSESECIITERIIKRIKKRLKTNDR